MTIIRHIKLSKRLILVATILLSAVYLTGCGSKEDKEASNQTTEVTETTTESSTEELTQVATEVSTEDTSQASTEESTEAPSEISKETSNEASKETSKEETTEASTEESAETVSETGEKFEMVRGGYYYVPAGFENITKEVYAVHYVQEWQNYSLDMYITVTDCMMTDIPVTLDQDYQSNKDGYEGVAELSYDTKSEDRYIISGTRNEDQRIFYRSVRNVNDRYVSYYIEYPASNSETCNKIVEDFVANFNY